VNTNETKQDEMEGANRTANSSSSAVSSIPQSSYAETSFARALIAALKQAINHICITFLTALCCRLTAMQPHRLFLTVQYYVPVL
jgi:hypothetical protein